jgi:tetratricopeptide (TPR) repeat protein
MNLDKLKEAARKYEQREDWRRAIEVYLQAIREAEATGGEPIQDPGLYNRVGDLEVKAGDFMAALRAYEEAAELYTDQGFFNNAIALCGKILRIDANRTAAYLRLAQLHARKNFVGEARRNLSDYLARMQGTAHRAEALRAFRAFAERYGGNPETQGMLIELLRSTPGYGNDQDFQDLAAALEAGEKSFARDESAAPRPARGAGPEHLGQGVAFHNDLIFLDTGSSMTPEGLESGGSRAGTLDRLVPEGSDSLVPEHADSSLDVPPHGAATLDAAVAAKESAAYHQDVPEGPEFEVEETGEVSRESGIITAESEAPRRSSVASDAGLPLDIGVLEATLRDLESESRWGEALRVAGKLIQAEPGSVPRYQKRVELAYFSGDRGVLIDSYLSLAGALARMGNQSQAALVYRRVLAHEADNEAAQQGLAALGPTNPSQPAAPPSQFIDLGALILEDSHPLGDTRIRVEERPVDEDEDRVFRDALADFKRGVEARLNPDDFEAHYDLGIAFKEMGLIDEAIAQFQKALRAPAGPRLKAAEQLGIAFYDQGQYGIAEVVLRRAANGTDGGEEDKLGVLYWLGRVLESQGKTPDALPLYEQAAALDLRFLDVRERILRLRMHP